MRHSENEKEISKKNVKKKSQLQKKKENTIIAVKRDTSLKNADYLKLIMRKPTIPKKNENERLKKNPNRDNLEKP
jgi:hypothetical protein